MTFLDRDLPNEFSYITLRCSDELVKFIVKPGIRSRFPESMLLVVSYHLRLRKKLSALAL